MKYGFFKENFGGGLKIKALQTGDGKTSFASSYYPDGTVSLLGGK